MAMAQELAGSEGKHTHNIHKGGRDETQVRHIRAVKVITRREHTRKWKTRHLKQMGDQLFLNKTQEIIIIQNR